MRFVVTAEQMQALDKATIEEVGLPGVVLMENAGRAVAVHIEQRYGLGAVAVVCGGGNNGGDGYVIARCLRHAGATPVVYLVAAREKIRGDAAVHLNAYEQVGGVAVAIDDADGLAQHHDAIESADVVVDCVFGTGLDRDVEGHYAAVIEAINRARGAVVAVDVPSGLSADTGAVLGVAVRADDTVTMACLKVGLAVAPGFARCGDVAVAEIGIPDELAQLENVRLALLESADVAPLLPAAAPLDHKNRRGHALVVAGSPGKWGAGRLAACAALRAGAGLVTLAGAGAADTGVADPVMTADLDGDTAALAALAQGKRAVAMGPGMDTGEGGKRLVQAALAELDVPLVLDADGLNHLGSDLARVEASAPPVVLTPHPGEAARLLGCTSAEVEADRVGSVRKLAEATRAVVVLKGARTLVCDGITGDGFVTINPTGGPALATAGTGDVLTGTIAGLIAQGVAPAQAAQLGVWLHGAAGDLAATDLGPRSVIASDLIDYLPDALRTLGTGTTP